MFGMNRREFVAGLAAAAAVSAVGAEAKALRVLAIGNSYTQSLFPELPKVAAAAGVKLEFDLVARGGWTLRRHWEERASTRLEAKLKEKAWDAVVLQEQSAGGMDAANFDPWADHLVQLVRTLCPTAKLFFQLTWSDTNAAPRVYGGPGKPGTLGVDQKGMYAALEKNYTFQARRFGARLIPVGHALELYRAKLPVTFVPPTREEVAALKPGQTPDLKGELSGFYRWGKGEGWEKDKEVMRLRIDTHHLNPEGKYLQACTWVAALFGVEMKDLAYVPDLGADFARRAPLIRACADESVRTFRGRGL